jgi:hypothetical protein
MGEHGNSHDDEREGYHGAATVLVDQVEHVVEVTATGHFEPISGRYTWYGRVRGLAEMKNGTPLVLRTPDADAEAAITERDLWGSHLIRGIGPPPFAAFDPSVLD